MGWLQDNLLAVFSVGVTAVLIYHYLIERGNGAKLSKRYRNSIFEAQSQIFLNASHYLISGNKDLAIKDVGKIEMFLFIFGGNLKDKSP